MAITYKEWTMSRFVRVSQSAFPKKCDEYKLDEHYKNTRIYDLGMYLIFLLDEYETNKNTVLEMPLETYFVNWSGL